MPRSSRLSLLFRFSSTLVGNLEEKRPLGRPRCEWKDNIRMDLRKVWWKVVNLMRLAQDRDQWRAVANAAMYLRVP
jgi:hypothetical protein